MLFRAPIDVLTNAVPLTKKASVRNNASRGFVPLFVVVTCKTDDHQLCE